MSITCIYTSTLPILIHHFWEARNIQLLSAPPGCYPLWRNMIEPANYPINCEEDDGLFQRQSKHQLTLYVPRILPTQLCCFEGTDFVTA